MQEIYRVQKSLPSVVSFFLSALGYGLLSFGKWVVPDLVNEEIQAWRGIHWNKHDNKKLGFIVLATL